QSGTAPPPGRYRLPTGPLIFRSAAPVAFWGNSERVIEGAVDEANRGPFTADVLSAGLPRT
ncbi:hypothetical protein O3Q52_51865, partial [Streptomyces sp. ActVer]|nr:hypothetical protein [Streptomyces sp. ActVer]